MSELAAQQPSNGGSPTRVIYVMSQPKSGSTILGVTIGNCEGVFYAGELTSWLLTEGRPVLGGIERTRFWRAVRESVPQAADLYGPQAFQLLERGQSALRVGSKEARDALRPRYRSVTEALYAAIAREAKAHTVVDSSHLPLRARELQQMPGVELYLLFLTRDVESVVASHTSHVKRHEVAERQRLFVETNGRMWFTYALALSVFRRQPPERRIAVQHEDFVAEPERVTARIMEQFELPGPLPDFAHLRTGLPLVANQLTREPEVALAARPAARHRSSTAMRLMQGPWQRTVEHLEPSAKASAGGS